MPSRTPDHDRVDATARFGVLGDQADGFGDHAAAAGLRVGPVADLGPLGVPAEALKADRTQAAAIVGIGDAPHLAAASRRELPNGVEVCEGMGDLVRPGQRDQPVLGPFVRAPSTMRWTSPARNSRSTTLHRPVRPAPTVDRPARIIPGEGGDPGVAPLAALYQQPAYGAVEDETGCARDLPRSPVAHHRTPPDGLEPGHVEAVVPDQPDGGAHDRSASGVRVQGEADLGQSRVFQMKVHMAAELPRPVPFSLDRPAEPTAGTPALGLHATNAAASDSR